MLHFVGDPDSSALPSNRGLLTYFARIAKTSNEDESVDLVFVTSLLSAGADINIGDKYGQTILHAIVRDWNTDVAKFVILQGSDINSSDDYGRTPLHVAAAANYPLMIEFLVSNGGMYYCSGTKYLSSPSSLSLNTPFLPLLLHLILHFSLFSFT